MKLSEYLKENGIKQGDFAAKVGITQSAISQIIKGQVTPKRKTALRIQENTGGQVLAVDLIFGKEAS